jgi:alanine-glyoxylate transaminase / (R)-3-amino-2-methylpropionate-pyruvate transaminase
LQQSSVYPKKKNPPSYLAKAFDITRQHGGVCISDEVQCGFGRTGENYWGFMNHGVKPDIVTMAKSIGNGFPLAAVSANVVLSRWRRALATDFRWRR